jgi:hypothetical protein
MWRGVPSSQTSKRNSNLPRRNTSFFSQYQKSRKENVEGSIFPLRDQGRSEECLEWRETLSSRRREERHLNMRTFLPLVTPSLPTRVQHYKSPSTRVPSAPSISFGAWYHSNTLICWNHALFVTFRTYVQLEAGALQPLHPTPCRNLETLV